MSKNQKIELDDVIGMGPVEGVEPEVSSKPAKKSVRRKLVSMKAPKLKSFNKAIPMLWEQVTAKKETWVEEVSFVRANKEGWFFRLPDSNLLLVNPTTVLGMGKGLVVESTKKKGLWLVSTRPLMGGKLATGGQMLWLDKQFAIKLHEALNRATSLEVKKTLTEKSNRVRAIRDAREQLARKAVRLRAQQAKDDLRRLPRIDRKLTNLTNQIEALLRRREREVKSEADFQSGKRTRPLSYRRARELRRLRFRLMNRITK